MTVRIRSAARGARLGPCTLAVAACVLLVAGCGSDDKPPVPAAATTAYPLDDTLRLNQIQVLGTHNSYHVQARPALFAWLVSFSRSLAESIQYTHVPLDVQFATQGIRQIELDVFADPDGGLFANRTGLRFVKQDTASGIPELDRPGFKVLHVQDLDFESTCWTFVSCLRTVKQWSDANPGHAPLMIQIEAKDDTIPIRLSAVPVPIDAAQLDALDAEIRDVFPARQLITPDEVRAGRASLEDAIRTVGWPTLGATRGRVLFTLDNGGRIRDAYVDGHPALTGRILFIDSPPGSPEAAFQKLNDPIGDFDRIRAAVAAGYLVRTRADADTVEARTGNTAPRDAAIASGAQFVSTDYPVPDPTWGTGYFAQIPGGTPARCNPISAPANCTASDIENPAALATR